MPVADRGDVNLLRTQGRLKLRARNNDKLGGIARQSRVGERLADGVVEMGPERIDRNGLAGNIANGLDRAVLEHIEDALDPFVQAAPGIGRDKVVASCNRVDHGGGRGRADVEAARCQRKEGLRPAGRITKVLQRDAGPLVIAEPVGQFVRINAAPAGQVAQGHGRWRRLPKGSARHGSRQQPADQ